MSDQNADFSIESLMEELESSTQNKSAATVRLKKCWMNSPTNTGNIRFVPLMTRSTPPIKIIKNVLEVKVYNDELGYHRWERILPMELYGELNDAQKALYNEVKGLFWEVKNKSNDWKVIRSKTYAVMMGHVLAHYDLENKKVDEYISKPTLIALPSASAPDAFKAAVNDMTSLYQGNQWMSSVFNVDRNKPLGYVATSFVRSSTGKGYNISFQFRLSLEDNDMDRTLFNTNGRIKIPDYSQLLKDPSYYNLSPRSFNFDYDPSDPESTEMKVSFFEEIRNVLVAKLQLLNGNDPDEGTPEMEDEVAVPLQGFPEAQPVTPVSSDVNVPEPLAEIPAPPEVPSVPVPPVAPETQSPLGNLSVEGELPPM